MSQEKITIKFEPKGDKALILAVKHLTAAQIGLEKGTKAYSRALKDLNIKQKKYNNGTIFGTNSNRLLANSFATIRSKMLLLSFAMSMGLRQLIGFTKEAAKIESMERAFNTLSGGAMSGSIAVEKLRIATNGTMSEFDLFQQANNAMVLGITKNSDEMAKMFDVAQRLGRALGKDTASSVESLITGIGRQSRLMLDNIGIIVKADEAYDRYAKQLGTTTENLTDAQKKTAFLEATMEAADNKISLLGDETKSSQDSFDRFKATTVDLSAAIGDRLVGALSGAMDSFSNFVDVQKEADFEMAMNTKSIEIMETTIKRLKDRISDVDHANNIFGVGLNAGVRTSKLQTDEIERLNKQIKQLEENLRKAKLRIDNFGETVEDSAYASENIGESVASLNEHFSTTLKIFEAMKSFNDSQEKGLIQRALFGKHEPMEFLDSMISVSDNLKNIKKAIKPPSMEFEKFTNKADKALDMMNQFSSSMGDAILHTQGFEASVKAMGDAFVRTLISMAAQMAARAALFTIFAPFFNLSMSGIGKFAFSGAVAHQGGLIKDDGKVQRFATGGAVRGGDNVPILAQGGEFVMQRSAVESIGIENLNRMNQGGGGAVTVNVSGNVLTQDFVEGELADNIKEAIRRGTDFGIS